MFKKSKAIKLDGEKYSLDNVSSNLKFGKERFPVKQTARRVYLQGLQLRVELSMVQHK